MTDADLRADLPAHQQAYTAFNMLILFAILLGLGGTAVLVTGFALSV